MSQFLYLQQSRSSLIYVFYIPDPENDQYFLAVHNLDLNQWPKGKSLFPIIGHMIHAAFYLLQVW